MNTQNKKAQAWTADFILMMMLLFLIVFLFIRVWDINAITWNNRIFYEDMWLLASRASDGLVSVQGLPPSWENLPNGGEENIQSLGLVDSKNVLNLKKLDRFTSLNYTLAKRRLGIARYDMLFTVYDLKNNITVASSGFNASENATRVVISRLVTYQDNLATLKLEVYK